MNKANKARDLREMDVLIAEREREEKNDLARKRKRVFGTTSTIKRYFTRDDGENI